MEAQITSGMTLWDAGTLVAHGWHTGTVDIPMAQADQ